jgi:hypothetical protein
MQFKMKSSVFAVVAALSVAAPLAFAQTKAPAAAAPAAAVPMSAKVNGVTIPKTYFDAMNKERGSTRWSRS